MNHISTALSLALEDLVAAEAFYKQLQALWNDECAYIEYGDPEDPYSYSSYLRIRKIATPGGPQYAIKELHQGMEGSGYYFANDDQSILRMRLTLLRLLHHFHRPMSFYDDLKNMGWKPKSESPALCFFLDTDKRLDSDPGAGDTTFALKA